MYSNNQENFKVFFKENLVAWFISLKCIFLCTLKITSPYLSKNTLYKYHREKNSPKILPRQFLYETAFNNLLGGYAYEN